MGDKKLLAVIVFVLFSVVESQLNLTNNTIQCIDGKNCELADNRTKLDENSFDILKNDVKTNDKKSGNINITEGTMTVQKKTGRSKPTRMDDVSMDNDEDDSQILLSSSANKINDNTTWKNSSVCFDRGKTYNVGDTFEKGCDESCKCLKNDQIFCTPICMPPYFKKGHSMNNPSCTEKQIDSNPCCVALICENDINTEKADEDCIHKNESYARGATFKDGCESICTCGYDTKVTCKPRCAPINNNTTESCVAVPDPNDVCCTLVLCDVEEHEHNNKVAITEEVTSSSVSSSTMDKQIISAIALNNNTVKLNLSENVNCNIQMSMNGIDWKYVRCTDNKVTGLSPGKKYHFKLNGTASNIAEVTIPDGHLMKPNCQYKGNTYNIGDEFHDGCDAFCVCEKNGVECATIECPTDFGLDVLDPQCLDWETHPPDFVAKAPNCCPDKVRCKDNGSCTYKGENFPNWSEIPVNVSGCEQRCYCEMGNVTCQQICSPVPPAPPSHLPCSANEATLSSLPVEGCCLTWVCPNNGHNTGYGEEDLLSHYPGIRQNENEIAVISLDAIDETTVRLVFLVPAFMVGLHGQVELRYTSDSRNMEVSTWEQQILVPPNDLITTRELEFTLNELQPNTTYKIKISLNMRELESNPTSGILTVNTPARGSQNTTQAPIIPIEAELRAVETNSTWTKLSWRTFSDLEYQFIDGIQLRYKELDDKVYAATPLIHRSVTGYVIENLKPDTVYEIGIYFIPFPGQTTELQAHGTIQIRTALENDPYKFDIMLEVHHLKSQSIELNWSGVPYPEDKYVNIFRAIYQSDGSREDSNTFKVAKRDLPQSTMIQDLKPSTRYHIWLEAYLTNGRIKKSNVIEFTTKDGTLVQSDTKQGKLEGVPLVESNNYYGPLIGVSIIAVLAIISTTVLTLILVRKHGTLKAPITTPINRKTNGTSIAAYDNPSYKTCESDRNGFNGNSIAMNVFTRTENGKEA